jgi:hypothetical protein
MAMPIVQPEEARKFSGPSPVAGVLYVDSEEPGWFVDDVRVQDISSMVETFVRDSSKFSSVQFRRIRNQPSSARQEKVPAKHSIPSAMKEALDVVSVQPPRAIEPFQLNFDYVDFVPAPTGRSGRTSIGLKLS